MTLLLDGRKAMHEKKIAREILAYLRDHPLSGDTVEGVSKWWLMQQRIKESVNAVQQVLSHLEKEGLVHERTMPDGRTLYFANTEPDNWDAVKSENDSEGGLVH